MTTIPKTLEQLRVPVASLKPYGRNPRRGDTAKIVESLQRHGQYRPIVVNARTQEVLAGNHTLRAARELGWDDIAATFVDVDEDTAARIVLIDNRSNDVAGYDDQLLAQLLSDLPDLEGTGFVEEDLDDLLASLGSGSESSSEDSAPVDPPVDPRTHRGDVWTMGEHRLMCGDCTNAQDVAKLLADARPALTFTSPPYLDLREYGGDIDLDPQHLASFIAVWGGLTDLIAVNLGLIVRDSEVVQHWDVYLEAARAAGVKLLSWNVWNREDATSMAAQRMMFPLWHEWVFVFGGAPAKPNRVLPTKNAGATTTLAQRLPDGSMTSPRTYPVAERKPLGTVLTSPSHKGPSDGDHPAVFPIALPTAYIESVTRPGDVVADPFGGSGTTLIAAENTGRRAGVMEIDPGYCDVIVDRWERHTGGEAELVRDGDG